MLLPTILLAAACVLLHAVLVYCLGKKLIPHTPGSEVKLAIEKQVEERYQSLRIKAVVTLIKLIFPAVLLLGICFGIIQSVRVGTVRWFHTEGEPPTVATVVIICCVTFILMSGLIERKCVKDWRRRNLVWIKDQQMVDCFLSVMMAGYAVQAAYAAPTERSSFRDSINSSRILVCMVFMQPLATAFWMTFIVVVYVGSVWSRPDEGALRIADDGDDAMDVALSEIAAAVLTCISTLIVKRMARSLARSEVDVWNSRKEVVATKSLLNTMCDVMVQLDGDLKVSGAHPALAALLFCQDSSMPRQLADAPFLQFLATDEDRNIFARHMDADGKHSSDPEQPSLSDAFQVSLRDKIGNEIRIQVFHIAFEVAEGSVHHLVGLTECGERQDQRKGGSPSGLLDRYGMDAPENSFDRFDERAVVPASFEAYAENQAVKKAARSRSRQKRSRTARGTPSRLEKSQEWKRTIGKELQPPIPAQTKSSDSLGGSEGSGPEEAGAGRIEHQWLSEATSRGYLHPSMSPTTQSAKEVSLVRTIMLWNFNIGDACCPFHAGLSLLMVTAQTMCQEECLNVDWSKVARSSQCESCGLLLPHPDLGAGANPEAETLCVFCKRGRPSRRSAPPMAL